MEWVLEIALIGLLAATLFHALRLERALGVLKRDRVALEDLVAEFNNSTRLAEQGIERLRNSADGAGRQISRQIDVAGGLKNDLLFLTERGERLADRLEQQVRSARTIDQASVFEQRAALKPGLSAGDIIEQVNCPSSAQADKIHQRDEPQLRLRSQAERDLLKALKMAR